MAAAKLELRVQVMGSQADVVEAVTRVLGQVHAAKAAVYVTALVMSESAAREMAELWVRLHGGRTEK